MMSCEQPTIQPLDYQQCRYGSSKLLFRGPKCNVKKDFHAFIGGTDTYGKYIETPFVTLLEEQVGVQCANLGVVSAGIDAFINEASILELCGKARTTVVQVLGAPNMSNRFYTVHPRRNDRLLKPSSVLETIYRDVDFSQYSFVNDMLGALREASAEKFEVVTSELKCAWVCRMEQMLSRINGRTVLLWLRDAPDAMTGDQLGAHPRFVDADMIDHLRPLVTEVLEVEFPGGRPGASIEGKAFPTIEIDQAKIVQGPETHALIAEKLGPML